MPGKNKKLKRSNKIPYPWGNETDIWIKVNNNTWIREKNYLYYNQVQTHVNDLCRRLESIEINETQALQLIGTILTRQR